MKFIDLETQYSKLKKEIDAGMKVVFSHGQFIMGPEVEELEQRLCSFTGRKHGISCANGTDALQMVFMAWGIGAGDAVFCPDITFVASVEPAVMIGATPIFCDITKDTYNLCPKSLERQIEAVIAQGILTPKVVIAVDFLGNPASYDEINCICKKYNLLLLEDAAQAFGASYKGKKCGSFGDAATVSFFPAKPLGCYGDGGAIFTDDDLLADILRSIRIHGKGPEGKYDNIRVGLNSRLDTLQAAILLAKFDIFEKDEINNRQIIASRYDSKFFNYLVTPFIMDNCISVYAQYALLAEDILQRKRILENLNKKQIPNMVYYPKPQHKLPVFLSTNQYEEKFDISIDYCSRTFSLPMHPYLNEQDQELIIEAVLEVL